MKLPIFSIKQPWAYTIIKKHQKVVSLPQKTSHKILNQWFALYCSNNFNHQDEILKFDGILPNKELMEQCGKILGIIRFSAVVKRDEAFKYDSTFTTLLGKSDNFVLISETHPLLMPKIFPPCDVELVENVLEQSSFSNELFVLPYNSLTLNLRVKLSKSTICHKDSIESVEVVNNYTRKTNVFKEIAKTLKSMQPKLFQSLPIYRKRLKKNIQKISRSFKNLSETQKKRFKSSCRAYICQHLVRRVYFLRECFVMANILKIDPQTIKKEILIFMSGVAKLYLAQIIEMSLCLQVEQNLNNFKPYDPIRPKHIREAIRKIEKARAHDKLITN